MAGYSIVRLLHSRNGNKTIFFQLSILIVFCKKKFCWFLQPEALVQIQNSYRKKKIIEKARIWTQCALRKWTADSPLGLCPLRDIHVGSDCPPIVAECACAFARSWTSLWGDACPGNRSTNYRSMHVNRSLTRDGIVSPPDAANKSGDIALRRL